MAGEALFGRPQRMRTLCKAVNVKPELGWRPQDVGRQLPKRAADRVEPAVQRCAAVSKAGRKEPSNPFGMRHRAT